MIKTWQFRGMNAFWVILLGQFFSILGSSMTNFAMTIWIFEKTGLATDLVLVTLFWALPTIILSPFTGTLVDRLPRNTLLIVSDLSAVLVNVGYLLLRMMDNLQIWHLYLGTFIIALFNTVQWPAFSAAMTLMLSKDQYTRANSLLGISAPGSEILSPIMAGALLPLISLTGILGIDILTAVIAVGSLLFIAIPDPEPVLKENGDEEVKGSFWADSMDGFRYLLKRPSLIGLQSLFMLGNFFASMASYLMLAPMILARTGNNELTLATVQSIAAVGGVVGGLIVGIWGGFKRQVRGVFLGWFGSFIGILIMGFGRATPLWMGIPIWGAGLFIDACLGSLVNASNQSIWQSKVAPDMQGRVFSIRRTLALLVTPISGVIAGPVADYVIEPAMVEGGGLANIFGPLVGTGPGSGMSLLYLAAGLFGILTVLIYSFIPSIRDIEDILPDHSAVGMPETAS